MLIVRLLILFLAVCGSLAQAKGFAPVVTQTATGVSVAVKPSAEAAAALSKIGNNVNTTSNIIANIAKGVTVPAVVTGAITGFELAGAWGAAIGVAGTVAIAALPAVAEWLNRAGVKTKPDGTLVTPDPAVCTTAPCYDYIDNEGHHYSTFAAACVYTYTAPGYQLGTGGTWPYCEYHALPSGPTQYGTGQVSRGSIAPGVGVDVPISIADAMPRLAGTAPTAEAVQELVDANFPPAVQPSSITGPAKVNETNVIKLGLDGSNTTETCAFYLEYFPSNIKAHPECTTTTSTPAKTTTRDVVTTAPDGTTSTSKVTTTTPAGTVTTTTKKDTVEQPETCGVPGGPPCKIDETGTPAYDPTTMKLDKATLDTASAAQRDTIKGTADKGMFSDWGQFFSLPALRACEPLQLPVYVGVNLGSMDVCPGAEWLRGLMAFVWAVSGFAFCFRCVSGVI